MKTKHERILNLSFIVLLTVNVAVFGSLCWARNFASAFWCFICTYWMWRHFETLKENDILRRLISDTLDVLRLQQDFMRRTILRIESENEEKESNDGEGESN